MSKVQKPTDRINPCLQHERRLLGCLLNYPDFGRSLRVGGLLVPPKDKPHGEGV